MKMRFGAGPARKSFKIAFEYVDRPVADTDLLIPPGGLARNMEND